MLSAAGGIASIQAGVNNGELWEWHTGAGWKIVPGSATSGANGIEISKDGKWFYMGGWGNQTFIRFSRGQTPVKRDEVPVGFRLDNLRWAPDGSLLAAGQEVPAEGIATSRVSKIDPNTLNVREASADDDDRHICPLQLGTIERCIRLWSNPGELVLSPFAGIGSEGYQAVKLGRRFVGVELKPEYFEAALTNLNRATAQMSLPLP